MWGSYAVKVCGQAHYYFFCRNYSRFRNCKSDSVFLGSGDECVECGLYHSVYVKDNQIYQYVQLSSKAEGPDNGLPVYYYAYTIYQKAGIYSAGVYRSCMGDGELHYNDGAWCEWNKNMFFSHISAFYILCAWNWNGHLQIIKNAQYTVKKI